MLGVWLRAIMAFSWQSGMLLRRHVHVVEQGKEAKLAQRDGPVLQCKGLDGNEDKNLVRWMRGVFMGGSPRQVRRDDSLGFIALVDPSIPQQLPLRGRVPIQNRP